MKQTRWKKHKAKLDTLLVASHTQLARVRKTFIYVQSNGSYLYSLYVFVYNAKVIQNRLSGCLTTALN
jgi:hypothetical protein